MVARPPSLNRIATEHSHRIRHQLRVNVPFVLRSGRLPNLKATASIVFSNGSKRKCSMNVDKSKSRNKSSVPVSIDSEILVAWSTS